MLKTKEQLLDEEDLCQYCAWTERGEHNTPKVVCYGGQPIMCEGSGCDDAYEYYLCMNEEEDNNEE